MHLTELKANSVIHQELFRLDDNNQRKTVINVQFIHIMMIVDGKRIPDCCYGGWRTEEKPTFIGADGRILGELLNLLSVQLNAQSLIRFCVCDHFFNFNPSILCASIGSKLFRKTCTMSTIFAHDI